MSNKDLIKQQALILIDMDDPLYDLILDDCYEYLIEYCNSGEEYIESCIKLKETMQKFWLKNNFIKYLEKNL
jgi:hypothetical protein